MVPWSEEEKGDGCGTKEGKGRRTGAAGAAADRDRRCWGWLTRLGEHGRLVFAGTVLPRARQGRPGMQRLLELPAAARKERGGE